MLRIWSCVKRSLATLPHDSRGVAATEFALIVPMMLVMFFGTVEVSSGVAVNRKITLVARTLSDLTSQSTKVQDADVTDFFAASKGIMWPYASSPIKATISELYIDPTTSVARVQWSKASGGASPRAVGDTVSVPPGLIGTDSSGKALPNQYLIFSEVSYLYQPIDGGYIMSSAGVTLSDNAYTRPRQSVCVILNSDDNVCPTS